MSYYDIQNLRRYLVSYNDIAIISIYCPALHSTIQNIAKDTYNKKWLQQSEFHNTQKEQLKVTTTSYNLLRLYTGTHVPSEDITWNFNVGIENTQTSSSCGNWEQLKDFSSALDEWLRLTVNVHYANTVSLDIIKPQITCDLVFSQWISRASLRKPSEWSNQTSWPTLMFPKSPSWKQKHQWCTKERTATSRWPSRDTLRLWTPAQGLYHVSG